MSQSSEASKPAKLRALLERGVLNPAPAAYDALTARLIEEAGFEAVYMSGYGTAAAHYGFADMGLLTSTEMAENAGRIADAVKLPVIADADTGYGNALNVERTVREYERRGVAGIQLEDQAWPKRCGHMAGKQVIPRGEMEAKVRAAADAREDPDFAIVARTDALATDGMEEAIARAEAYAEAGADLLFIEAPRNRDEIAEIAERLRGRRLVLNLAPKTPAVAAEEIAALGYAIAIYPGVCLVAAMDACRRELGRLKATGVQENLAQWTAEFGAMNDFLGAGGMLRRLEEWERRVKREG